MNVASALVVYILSDMPDESSVANQSPAKKELPFNTIGLVVLIVGCLISIGVYWVGARSADHSPQRQVDGSYSDDPLSTGDSKRSSRDVEMMSGKLGVWMAEWSDYVASWGPTTTPALIIAGASVVVALGCFAKANHLI